MKVEFTIPVKPVAKQRPRLAKNGHVYTPTNTKVFEHIVTLTYGNRYCFNKEYIKVKAVFRFKIPNSYTKAQKHEAIIGNLRPTKGDVDNYIKALLDGLNGVAWTDDRYIVNIEAEKKYANEEGIDVVIENV